MSFRVYKNNIVRSQSLGALDLSTDSHFPNGNGRFCDYSGDSHTQSDLSLQVCGISEDRNFALLDDHLDSGFVNLETSETSRTDHALSSLELKVIKLSEILQEQHNLLQALKEEIVILKTCTVKNTTQNLKETEGNLSESSENANGGGKILLDAIELKRAQSTETDLRDILTEYLKSDELKNHIAETAVERMKEVMKQCLSETFTQVYLPFLERSQRRLLIHVTRTLQNAFHELNKSVNKSSCALRCVLEKQLILFGNGGPDTFLKKLEINLETILRTELIEWSKRLLRRPLESSCVGNAYDEKNPSISLNSAPQPSNPEQSIIDQLMKSAGIKRQIQNGEINKAFEEALSSLNLSLVMAACRAAAPQHVFRPCTLKQPVLLALIQQLATDMVHDTQLKCRYLEDALSNLDLSDQTTRAHLPLVVGEIQKHLSKFLRTFPCHVASSRITMIMTVADNLLYKQL